MLEGVISQVVNRFLGEYVEGLDSQQLRIHILRGELKLENLTIKGHVLNEKLPLPVEVVFGHIGLLHVTWDWLALKSKPVTVIVSDVNILLRDKSIKRAREQGRAKRADELEREAKEAEEARNDPKKAEELRKSRDPYEQEMAEKADKLAAAEEIRLAPDEQKEAGFVEKMIQGVLANLRVLVRHIHVRYEHKLDPRNPCAVGLTLEEMRISSAGPDWEKVLFVSSDQEHARKLIELTGVGVYCNHHQVLWPPNQETMRTVFDHQVVKKETGKEQEEKSAKDEADEKKVNPIHTLPSLIPVATRSTYEYLLQMDGSIRLTLNKIGASRGADEPLASVQAAFPLIDFTLRRRQFLALIGLVNDLTVVAQKLGLAPTEEEKKQEEEEKKSLEESHPKERVGTAEERERYIYLYKRTLSSSWLPELDDAELKELQTLEREIEYKSLDEWRIYGIAELRAEMPDIDEDESVRSSSTLSSATSSADDSPPTPFSRSYSVSRQPLEKRSRAKDRGLLATMQSTISTAVQSVGSVATAIGTSILPGSITDRLGLTTEAERSADAAKEAERKEMEECAAPFAATPLYSPDESFSRDESFASAVSYNTPGTESFATANQYPTGSPSIVSTTNSLPGPIVVLTDEERAAVRAAALKAEQAIPSTSATDPLFLPTDDRSHDALQATADVRFDKISFRLLDNESIDLFTFKLEKIRARVAARLDTQAVQFEMGRISMVDERAWGYPYIISTNVGSEPSANGKVKDGIESDGSVPNDATKPTVDANTPFIILQLSRLGTTANNAIEVDVEMNNLQVYLLPSLLKLPEFFEMPKSAKEQSNHKVEEMKHDVARAKREEERKATEARADSLDMADSLILKTAGDPSIQPKKPLLELPPFPIYARFRMNHPLIILPIEPNADDTRGLILSWAIDLSACVGGTAPGSIQAQLNLNAFSMIESRITLTRGARTDEHTIQFERKVEPGTRPILSPFHVKLAVNTSPSALFLDGQAQNVSLDMRASRLDLNVGFRVYQMLAVLMKEFMPELEDGKSKKDESKESLNPNRKVVKSIEDHLQEEKDEAESAIPQDPFGPMIAALPIVPLNFHEINASIEMVGIYIDVINDIWSTSLPFMRLQIENLSAKVHRFGDSGGMCATLHLRSEAYNHRLLAWEPVIEPWSVTLSVNQCQFSHTPGAGLLIASRDHLEQMDRKPNQTAETQPVTESAVQAPLAPITSITLSSKAQFNFNISAALLEDVVDTYSLLMKELRRKENNWRLINLAPPYRLENHTDLAIQVYRANLSQIDDEQDGPSELMDLLPFSNATFDFADDVSIPSRALRLQLISAHGVLPLLTIPVSREASSKHQLQPIGVDGTMTVLVDITWDAGVRVISIHSAWGVANRTNIPILVSGDRYVEKELKPGEEMWLPLLLTPMMHTIRVRPSPLESRSAYLGEAFIDGSQADLSNLDGEYQWSEEIVLTSTQKQTKRKDGGGPVMLEHYSCSRETSQLLTAPSSALETSSASSSSSYLPPKSDSLVDFHVASTTAPSQPFHFTCFHSGLDTIDDGEMIDGIEVPKTREFRASVFEIRTPITCENVLADEVNIRLFSSESNEKDEEVALKNAKLVQELTLGRGQSCPIFAANTVHDTYISLKLPHLAAGWSKPVKLKVKDPESAVILPHLSVTAAHEVVLAHILGDNGGMLPISIELRAFHGNLRVVLYTQYWLWDLSSLSLQITPDQKMVLPSRAAAVQSGLTDASVFKNSQAHLESISLPDKHHAVMFGFDNVKSSKGKVSLRAGRHPRANGFDLCGPCVDPRDPQIQWSEWSEKIPLEATGIPSAISMPMGPGKSAGSYEVVVDVQPGEGKFYRTMMVKFLPRFILLNLLPTPVHLKQYGLAEGKHLTLASTQQIIWHWPQHVTKDHPWIAIRRQPDTARSRSHRSSNETDEWHWSGYFKLDTPGDQNIMVRSAASPSRVWYLHVEIRQRNGINFIMLNEHDPTDLAKLKVVIPHCISNRSKTELIRVRQQLNLKKNGSKSSHFTSSVDAEKDWKNSSEGFQWIEVPPMTDLPFSFEEPLLKPQSIEVQVALRDGETIRSWTGKDHSTLSELDLEDFDEPHAYIDYTHFARSSEALTYLESHLTPAAWERRRANPARHRLYFFNEQDGPSNFIVFSDEPSDSWKKSQMRLKRDQQRKQLSSDTKDSFSFSPFSSEWSRRSSVASPPVFHDEPHLTPSSKSEEKEHLATIGERETGATDISRNTLGVHTEEQVAHQVPQSAVEESLLTRGHGVVVDERAVISEDNSNLVTVGASRGLEFNLNPTVIRDRVAALRVRVGTVKGLRRKDKHVFARMIFGSVTRETEARKRKSAEKRIDLNQEVIFQGEEVAMLMQQQSPSPSACSCFAAASSTPSDRQHLFVDLYEKHIVSNVLIGSVSINLANLTNQPVQRWYELRKFKGSTSELRGAIEMTIWFEMKDGTSTINQDAEINQLIRAHPNPTAQDVPIDRLSTRRASASSMAQSRRTSMDEEPRGELSIAASAPPDQLSNASFAYANASVYASSLRSLPKTQNQPPRFESLLLSKDEDAEELERVCVQMMEEDAIKNCSWSEYSIRLIDTLNLDRVASALMVDLSAGRVVCYLTAPMFRRGYSVLIHDRQHKNIIKSWSNQEIVIVLPDQLAAIRKTDAVVRMSFYYFPVTDAPVQTKALLRSSYQQSAVSALSSLDVNTNGPLLLATTVIPLLSIHTVKLDALNAKEDSDPSSSGGIDDEEAHEVDVDSMDRATLERYRYRKRVERQKYDAMTPAQRRMKEWDRKWITLATPGQNNESAELCISIKRKEVKMPVKQAVSREDQCAAYTPARIRFKLHLPHIGVSLIDSQPEEVAYFSMQHLSIQLHDSATMTSFKMSLDSIQVDNLLRDAIFPVIMNASSVPPKDWLPVMQLVVCRQKLPGCNIQCFPYASFLLQMMDVRISELSLYKILDFVNDLGKRIEQQPTQKSVNEEAEEALVVYRRMSDEFTLPKAQLRSIYTKFLHLQPLAINMTFAANPGVRSKFLGESFAGGGWLGSIVRSAITIVGAGVGSLDSAPIRLNGKVIEHHLGSPDSFVDILTSHYIKEGIKQTYAVLGSLEIIGNPVGTASQLSEGVKEAFYMPAQGLMVSPEAFGQGLAEGSLSLLRHSIAGLGGAVAGVLSSGGKAAAALSLDSDFITRSSIRNAAEPDHVGQGIKLGAVSLANGVKEGVTGIVLDPVRGAQQDGAKGLVKGIGKGVIGAFAKPVAGILNALSQTSKGIANTGTYMADGPRPHLGHVRAKRFIDPLDGKLTVYDKHASEESLEADEWTAGDVHKRAIRQEASTSSRDAHESITTIIRKQPIESQPWHLHDEGKKVIEEPHA